MDLGSEIKTTKNIKIFYYFKNKSLFWLIYMNNKLINKKNHSFEYHIFIRSDPDPDENNMDPLLKHCNELNLSCGDTHINNWLITDGLTNQPKDCLTNQGTGRLID